MEVLRAANQPTVTPPDDNFTGTVYMDRLASPNPPSRLMSAKVTFDPGARTAWHTHPRGQVLHGLFGVGRVQEEGGPVRAIYPGDTVVIPPDVRHWHGAAPDSLFRHLAMSEVNDEGIGAVWQEKVSDADYSVPPTD